jgi:hypothetical protein
MASPNCLAGCIADYVCGPPDFPGPAGQQAESFAPWCWVRLSEGGEQITVGNESFKGDPNTACIKSMEIGWIDTPSIKVEIIDEAGGTLNAVANSLRKCIKRSGKGTTMSFQWGWVMTTCESGRPIVIPSIEFKCFIQQFDVNYSEGKIKYIIEGAANDKLFEVMREDVIIGDDEYPADIESAIGSLCAREPQCTVRYVELQPDGKLKDVKFEWARLKKPEASWQSDNMNRISIIRKWFGAFRVKDGKCDKGIVPFFSPEKPDELILMKDPQPNPGEATGCQQSIGTFIVNGGKCSSVIEFTPTMNIVAAVNSFAVGGDTSGPNKSTNQFAERKRCDNQKSQGDEAGTQLQATITQQAFDSYGVRAANDENLKSEIAHNRAAMVTNITGAGVEADLKILGNPTAPYCQLAAFRPVSIVVINPFALRGGGCGDWLARPGCNQLFTNRLWHAVGINHTISPGTYTTTLKLQLPAGDIQVSASDPLGGPGSGGPVLENGCI